MEKQTKKRMRNKKFIAIWTPILSVLLIIMLLINVAAISASAALDGYLGKGERHVEMAEGTEDWNTDYYSINATNSTEARENAEAVAEKVGDEGIVLLKNNGALPYGEGSTITPFGYGYLNPAYTGTGAGAADGSNNVSPSKALERYFLLNNAAVDQMNSNAVVSLIEADGTFPANTSSGLLSNDSTIYGYDPSIFNTIADDLKDTESVVFITRQGNEGSDKKYDGYTDGTPHYLALSQSEKETIKFAKDNSSSVTVVIISSNAMELSPIMGGPYEADAILQIGNPGARGFASMAKIMAGEVNPSGRLVDIYPTDFTKDPTYQNIGEFSYSNATYDSQSLVERAGETLPSYYIEYQEGIYSGYRYYETAEIMEVDFIYGELDEMGGIETFGAVAYPFGYGMSYTEFDQSISTFTDNGDSIDMTVRVENKGAVAGKEVVQIYYSAPYTEFSRSNKIEKSAVNLVAFDKTDIINPGESEEVTISFLKEDMASYSYTHDNDDGTRGAYVLEEGEYIISLRKDSHNVIDSRTTDISSTIWYDHSNPRQSEVATQSALDEDGNLLEYPKKDPNSTFIAATNQFEESNEYMTNDTSLFSRSDWENTFPVMDENRTKEASETVLEALEEAYSFDYENDPKLGNVEESKVYTTEMPNSGLDNGLVLSDMRGKDYHDEDWDHLLDQIDWDADKDDIQALLFTAGYQTGKLDSIGKPATMENDGDMGLKIEGVETSAWMSKPVLASTWNVDLMYEVGEVIAQEAAIGGLDGWYAPGMNIHRSPFSGRNLEYFSEDGLLSGKLAAAMVSGAGDHGLYTFIKHFAVNDQETNRQYFLNTWADEQTMREIYLKPFEIVIKEARMTIKYISDNEGTVSTKTMPAASGVMSAQSSIGTTIAMAHHGLLTEVLRNEWGFNGSVISDLYFVMGPWLRDQALRAGQDLYLMMNIDQLLVPAEDYESATARTLMRDSIHNISYMIANSSVMNNTAPGTIISYGISPWVIWLNVGNVIVFSFIILVIIYMIRRTKDSKRFPEKYKAKGKKLLQ